MCFSPQMDATAGVLITAVGIDALRQVRSRRQLPVAVLPLLFGVHQLVETFVWLGLRGEVSSRLGDVATWIYLLIALVVVPVAVPAAALALGVGRWRWLDVAFLGCGVAAAVVAGLALGVRVVPHRLDGHQISYSPGVPADAVVLTLYVAATCGPWLLGRARWLQAFAVVNLIVVGTLAWLNQSGVISLWCVWAAFTSVLIDAHLRDLLPREAVRTS